MTRREFGTMLIYPFIIPEVGRDIGVIVVVT